MVEVGNGLTLPLNHTKTNCLFSCTGSTKFVFTMSPKPAWTISLLLACVGKARITPVFIIKYKK